MGKTLYQTNKIMVGGTEIKVRQPALAVDVNVPKLVSRAVMYARGALRIVQPQLVTDAYVDKIRPAFSHCFHAAPTPERLSMVSSVFSILYRALHLPFAVKVKDMPGLDGKVNIYCTGPVCLVAGARQFFHNEEAGTVSDIHRQGEIHLTPEVLRMPLSSFTTLIHEAGHKFADLSDFGERGYFRTNFTGYREGSLSWQEAMRNADSYAVYAMLVSYPEVAKKRFAHLKARERAVRGGLTDDVMDGVSDLFG